ncbi:hypothetical protein [Acinetobacter baumannii]|nr:hypothetical protein [Acinetobacter baumannii]
MPKAQSPELKALFELPPSDAISYLEKKGFKIGWDWHERALRYLKPVG